MEWFREPPSWKHEGDTITVTSAPGSDFWRKTHYGFIRDNGHFYHQPRTGDFTVEVKITGEYRDLYDQAGVMVRLDETTWMKCGIEFVHGAQFASAVVTRDYSDWSVVPLPQNLPSLWLRVKRSGSTIEVLYSLNGENYAMLRMTHLTDEPVQAGIMTASPDGAGFTATFEGLTFHTIQPAHGG